MTRHDVPLEDRVLRLPLWAQEHIESLSLERDRLTQRLAGTKPQPAPGEPPQPGELSLHQTGQDGRYDTAIRGWSGVQYHGRYDTDSLMITPADADGSYATAGLLVRSLRGRIAVLPLSADIVLLRGYILARGDDEKEARS